MPAIRTGSLAVGVFGLLHADERIYALEDDCYSAFHALSAVTGRLSVADAETPSRGSWGMNDAGGPWLGNDPTGRRGQFQVTPAINAEEPLPIEALTCTAVAAVERFGPLELHGLEYYLPLESAGPATQRIESGRNWFALADSRMRTRVRVTLDSGESPASSDHRADILAGLVALGDHEHLDAQPEDDANAVDFANPVPWRWWLGDGPAHTLTFGATASEWTPLALGHVVTLFAEACRSAGVTEPLGVRVTRSA